MKDKETESRKIDQWVEKNREAILLDIQKLVRIPSVKETLGDPDYPYGEGIHNALEYMLESGREMGLCAENHEDRYGLISMTDRDSLESIGIFSHLDVVAPGDGWFFPPFSGERMNGFIIGRGSIDNKGPAVAVLYLMKYLMERKLPLRHNFFQYLGCDEESGMSDIPYFLNQKRIPKLSVVPDLMFPVCYAEKGMLSFRLTKKIQSDRISQITGGIALNVVPDRCSITLKDGQEYVVFGKSAHSAFPEHSENAVGKLMSEVAGYDLWEDSDRETFRLIQKMAEDYTGAVFGIDTASGEFGDLTCVLCRINFEEQKLMCDFNIRYPAVKEKEDLVQTLQRFSASAQWEITILGESSASYFPKDHPAAEVFVRQYEQWTGFHSEPYVTGGGTYARKLPNAFAAGLGLPHFPEKARRYFAEGHGGAHQPDEMLEIDSFIMGMKILISSVVELDKI